jgi:sugar O-acyltransferase (sialic acid O-acetyltransferase NeuD family)
MKTLAILGASGHGKVVADAALCAGWNNIIFFDDRWPELREIGSWKVVGNTESLLSTSSQYDEVIVAIGSNPTRLKKINHLKAADIPLATIIHPKAICSSYVKIEPGVVIFAGAIINIDSSIGVGSIINTGATIDHDCQLGECVHVSPGAHLAGSVCVGDLSWIGIGSSVRQNIIIGTEVIVGAGAVVVKNIQNCCTVIGVPARIINKERIIC